MARAASTDDRELPVQPACWPDVLASTGIWATSLVGSAGVTFALSRVWDAQLLLQLAVWLVIGLVVLPTCFALALAIVGVVLSALLALLAAPSWLLGRATGLGSVLCDLWALAGHVLPGYCAALRKVRRPGLWGMVAGVVAGVSLHGLWHGWS